MATTVKISSNQLRVDVTGATGDPRDFVAVYRPDAANNAYVDWKYLANDRQNKPKNGVTSGTVNFTLQNPTGSYEIRVLTATATNTFTVIPGSSVSLAYTPINIGPTQPTTSVPTSVTLAPSSASFPETSLMDTIVSTPTTATNDNTTFTGVYSFNNTALKMKDGKIVLSRNLASRDIGATTVTVTATQNSVAISTPLALTVTAVVPVPPPTGAGYTATIQLGNPVTGPIYAFSPDPSLPGQTATDRGNFTSDFANFTQNSIEVIRSDTPFRVHFRKDIAPNPARFECVISLGQPTLDHTAANAGPFTFILYRDGTKAYTITAPSMGWHTRRRCWTHDGTTFHSDPALDLPRPEIRDRTKLGPANLNFLPNFSQSMATTFRCPPCGTQGGFRAQTSYSGGTNTFGINENCGLASYTGGVGDRADIGILTDWASEYVITGSAAARTTMFIHAEVAGGMPWNLRDSRTGAPINLITDTNPYFGGSDGYDLPNVYVPSTGDVWSLETNHLPSLSYLPYILTGDPFYLENLQFQANWTVGTNVFHRYWGYAINYADPATPVADNKANIPLLTAWRLQTRGLGWAMRDFGMFYRATPDIVPSWLLPKSYAKDVLEQNRAWGEKNSLNNAYVKANYPGLDNFGIAPAAVDFEEGFFVSYGMMGIAFVINHGPLPEWKPFYEYFCRLPIGLTIGGNGWPPNFPSPYTLAIQSFSTDYDPDPLPIVTFADLWSYNNKNAIWGVSTWGNSGSPTYRSTFPARIPLTNYICNSWILEVRTGVPTLPNLGDKIDFTISGSFPGSPATVTHTIDAADIDYLKTLQATSPSVPNTTIMDDLLAKINSSAVGAAGINAVHTESGEWVNRPMPGRIYLSFDSTKVGNIVVTGQYTSVGPNKDSSIYIQPNGDGVCNGTAGPNLLARPLNYQAASTGTSGTGPGPIGQVFNSPLTDGSVIWYYVPENKSAPFLTPWTDPPKPPTLIQLFATLDNGNPQPHYAVQALAGLNMALNAGVPNAATATANLNTTVEDWFANWDTTLHNRFSFCIAP